MCTKIMLLNLEFEILLRNISENTQLTLKGTGPHIYLFSSSLFFKHLFGLHKGIVLSAEGVGVKSPSFWSHKARI